eukprot:GSChrysophyteH1.ASY1.ANO1.288.1 assembled CDS
MASLLGTIASGLESPKGLDFFELVKAIGESKSKQEEDRIIASEIAYLKRTLPSGQHSAKKLKEMVIRSLYVEMLGQDGSFAYMRIVELCASANIAFKKAGYLAASLTLHPGHEFRLMLVNRMQQDMKSTNVIESTTALGGLDKSCMEDHHDKLRRVICDKDPAVMGASLGFLLEIVKEDVAAWKDLVPSLVSILKQIIEHRLAKEFDYHRIPAPWLQINLLRLLAALGRGDQSASEDMYEVLAEVMKRSDTGINVGYAIVFETVITVTSIYPNPVLLDAAATSISRFIRSESHNLKYIGIKGLAAIVKDHPRYAADHQMAVVDCLEDPDETLKRKTLSLLFRMTNSVNVEFIIKKLLASLEQATDDHFRSELVSQIVQCAERYAPTNAWFVRTMIRVFELAGEKLSNQMAQTMADDDDLRAEAVESFLVFLERPKLPELTVQTLCWVLGEYGYLSRSSNVENIVDSLCKLASTAKNSVTRGYVVTAIMKLVAQMGHCPGKALQIVQAYTSSQWVDVHQRCDLFTKLLKHPNVMVDVLPVDASCEDIEVDENLSFLNQFVNAATTNGARQYAIPENLKLSDHEQARVELNITPYEKPVAPVIQPVGGLVTSGENSNSSNNNNSSSSSSSAADNVASPATIKNNMTGNSLLIGGARGLGGGGGPWSRKMEAPKAAERKAKEEQLAQTQATAPVGNNSTSPLGAATSGQPFQPREPTEKERMAAALFGGFGGGSAPKQGVTRRSRGASAAAAPQPTSDGLLNMDDDVVLSGDADRVGLVEAGVAATPANNLFDMDDLSLLGGGVDLSADIPPPTPPPTAEDSGMLFSGMSLTGDSPLQPPAAPAISTTKPLQLTTPEFGAKWGACPMEVKKVVAPCEIPTLPHLKTVMEGSGRYAHVESIDATQEAIFAASSADTVILVHVKLLQGEQSEVTVRSPDMAVTTSEFADIDMLIKNS